MKKKGLWGIHCQKQVCHQNHSPLNNWASKAFSTEGASLTKCPSTPIHNKENKFLLSQVTTCFLGGKAMISGTCYLLFGSPIRVWPPAASRWLHSWRPPTAAARESASCCLDSAKRRKTKTSSLQSPHRSQSLVPVLRPTPPLCLDGSHMAAHLAGLVTSLSYQWEEGKGRLYFCSHRNTRLTASIHQSKPSWMKIPSRDLRTSCWNSDIIWLMTVLSIEDPYFLHVSK